MFLKDYSTQLLGFPNLFLPTVHMHLSRRYLNNECSKPKTLRNPYSSRNFPAFPLPSVHMQHSRSIHITSLRGLTTKDMAWTNRYHVTEVPSLSGLCQVGISCCPPAEKTDECSLSTKPIRPLEYRITPPAEHGIPSLCSLSHGCILLPRWHRFGG